MTAPAQDPSQDWPALIARLELRYSHLQIALKVGRSPDWVSQLKRGIIREPPYSVACLLIALDEKVSRQTQDSTDSHREIG